MDPLSIAAASGMKARMESLDMLANNIANASTAGFKADREFYNLYQQQLPLIDNRWTDFSQGTLTPTASPLDLALSGPGFFALNGPTGPVYTRNGAFRLSKSNELVSADGYPLRNALDQGRPLRVDPTLEIAVGKDGTVSQAGQTLGQIEIDQIATPADAMAKLGNTYFSLKIAPPGPGQQNDPAQQNLSAQNRQAGAESATPQETEILQGHLEQSNVTVSDSTVRLVSVMRQFEMLQKALNIGTQMNKEALQDVARPS